MLWFFYQLFKYTICLYIHTLLQRNALTSAITSQHFDVVHSTSFCDVGLARKNSWFHATHILALRRDCLSRGSEADIVHDALPRVITLSVFFDQSVVLFFLDNIVRAALFNLIVSLLLPWGEVGLSLYLAVFLLSHLFLLLVIQFQFSSLILLFDFGHHGLLFLCPVVFILLDRHLESTTHGQVCLLNWLLNKSVIIATAKITKIANVGHVYFSLLSLIN